MRPDIRDVPPAERESLTVLAHRLIDEGKGLALVELELARAEVGHIAGKWGGAVALLWVCSVLLTALVVVLALAAVFILSATLQSQAWAVAAVSGALVVLIAILALIARSMMKLPDHPASLLMQWMLGNRRSKTHG